MFIILDEDQDSNDNVPVSQVRLEKDAKLGTSAKILSCTRVPIYEEV